MICPKCGTETVDGSQTCGNCGAVLTSVESTNPVTNVEDVPVIQPPVQSTNPQVLPTAEGQTNNSDNRTLIVIGSVVLGLIILSLLSYFGWKAYTDYRLVQVDKEVLKEAEKLPTLDVTLTPTPKNEVKKTGSVTNTWQAYQIAKAKISYKNPGIFTIKTIYDPLVKQGSYEFVFIDKDSGFKKDDYNYFKSTSVQVVADGNFNLENNDQLADNQEYYTNSLVLTEQQLSDVVAKAKESSSLQGGSYGQTYAIFYNTGSSDLSPATWEVYFAIAGQDETSKGFKTINTQTITLDALDLSEKSSMASTVSFIIE
ncbi:MAG: zinc ribbon domain-containing protein [bacterium]